MLGWKLPEEPFAIYIRLSFVKEFGIDLEATFGKKFVFERAFLRIARIGGFLCVGNLVERFGKNSVCEAIFFNFHGQKTYASSCGDFERSLNHFGKQFLGVSVGAERIKGEVGIT